MRLSSPCGSHLTGLTGHQQSQACSSFIWQYPRAEGALGWTRAADHDPDCKGKDKLSHARVFSSYLLCTNMIDAMTCY